MRKVYSIPLGWFILYMALLTALCAAALTLALIRWPVATGVVMAAGVSVLMLVMIVHIVTTAPPLPPLPPEKREPPATVDGRPVWDVEVLP